MPRGKAAAMREAVAKENVAVLELKHDPCSTTGFVAVQENKYGKFRARLQVPGDGRGGQKKRKQCAVPGLFNTAEEAAVALAIFKRDMKARNDGKVVDPPKQYKPRKSSGKQPPQPAPLPQLPVMAHMPMATAMAIPIPYPMLHAPLVTASPLPMLPLGVAPPL